jgi:hypothetical protein
MQITFVPGYPWGRCDACLSALSERLMTSCGTWRARDQSRPDAARPGLRRGGPQRAARLRPRWSRATRRLRLATSEWCLLAGIACGLVAAGVAYTSGSGNPLTGTLAILAVLALLLGLVTFWRW